jgi:hypothetical protein
MEQEATDISKQVWTKSEDIIGGEQREMGLPG